MAAIVIEEKRLAILKEFIKLYDMLPLSFLRTLSTAFGADKESTV